MLSSNMGIVWYGSGYIGTGWKGSLTSKSGGSNADI